MKITLTILSAFFLFSCSQSVSNVSKNEMNEEQAKVSISVEEPINFERDTTKDYSQLSNEDWKGILTSMEYYILREKGTERAFTGEYVNNKKRGFMCAKVVLLLCFDPIQSLNLERVGHHFMTKLRVTFFLFPTIRMECKELR